jgi:hypothetical protein
MNGYERRNQRQKELNGSEVMVFNGKTLSYD